MAQSSAETLTALGFTLPITTAMVAIAIGTSIRCNNKVIKSACLEPEKLSQTITSSLTTSSLTISSIAILGLMLGPTLLSLLGNDNWHSDHISIQSTGAGTQQDTYMSVRYLSWIFLAVIWQINAIFRALGHNKLASNLMISWLAVKSMLAIILLSPTSLFYQEGLLVVAVIHSVSDTLFAIISLYYLAQKVDIKLPTFTQVIECFHQPKTDSTIVISQQLITPLSMGLLTAFAAGINYHYVASFALLFRMEAFFLLLPMVLTTSMPAIIGTNYWSGHSARVKAAYKQIFASIIIFQLVVALLLFYYSDWLTALFCPQQVLTSIMVNYMSWVPIGYLGAGCAIVYQSCLNAKGKVKQAATLALMHRIILVIPLAFIGSLMTIENGFFIGIMLGHLGAGLSVVYLFRQTKILYTNEGKKAQNFDLKQN